VVEVDETDGGGSMGNVIFDMSMSLDGFVKGASSNSRQRCSPNRLPSQCHRRPGCLVSGPRVNSGIRKVMVMRVFVAGGTGVIGRRLVPQLVARGHQVTVTTTSPGKLGLLEQLGADAVVMDRLDAASVGEAVAEARPEAIVHQMTAIGGKKPDMTIRSVIDPDKLGHVDPVADAWAVIREANQARRPTDRPEEPTALQTCTSSSTASGRDGS
jgi:NAD(P)H-binding